MTDQKDDQLGMVDKAYNKLREFDYQDFMEWLNTEEEHENRKRYKNLGNLSIVAFGGAVFGALGPVGFVLLPLLLAVLTVAVYKEDQCEEGE